MSAERALRIAAYLVVATGVAALYLGALIGPLGLALVALALGIGWRLRERAHPTAALGGVLAAGVVVFAGVDFLYLAESPFDAFVHLLVLLVLLRLGTARRPRDFRDAGLLAFFMLVASSAITVGLEFFFVLVAFLVAGICMLLLAHELSETERAGAADPLPVGAGLVGLGLAASAGALLTTLGLFFVIPRVGEATVALRSAARRTPIGFSDRVELGAIGELETDAAVAMRVYLADGPPSPDLLPRLRWRGVALDRFDGRAWSAQLHRRVPLLRSPGGPLELGTARGTGRLVTQEVFLEPIGTDALFAAPHAVRLRIRGGALADDMGAISVPTPLGRVQYTVESEVGRAWPERLGSVDAARYLQLPSLPPRIPALAREVSAGAGNATATALALTNFLSREFRYTLKLERTTALEPLEEFLFVRRAGNCEYFATALAVMLRSLGIPARVITGFQQGEWNPYGQHFLVRMGDAHAWVEAYLAGAGWVTFDPSPRGSAGAFATSSGAGLWIDALRLRWYRYIVNWSRQDQVRVAATLRRAAWTAQPWRVPWRASGDGSNAALLALALATGGLAWLVWRHARPGAVRIPPPAVPDFYRRALRCLARRGLRPAPAETAREFSARVGAETPARAAPFAVITAAYEAVRFGSATLSALDTARMDACLGALAHFRP
ncbi:MAG TPA: DUF3488 and transglutaminase-like domain-containing protein [Methylomirabilota bacterium]|jgi:transglutaminase-like putative cysteine protease|nr:DUF3488 and transglutaminase-like domain-containing protein [Methylomirabilota bacterium]